MLGNSPPFRIMPGIQIFNAEVKRKTNCSRARRRFLVSHGASPFPTLNFALNKMSRLTPLGKPCFLKLQFAVKA